MLRSLAMMAHTTGRLLAETADPGAPPVVVRRGPAQREVLEELRRAVSDETRLCEWEGHLWLTIEIVVDVKVDERYGQPLRAELLAAFKNDQLFLGPRVWRGFGADMFTPSISSVPLGGPAHLARAAGAIRARLEAQAKAALRREKLRKLGERSVQGKVAALAKRMGSRSYYVEHRTRWFRLVVALGYEHQVVFEVDYRRTDQELAEVVRVVTELDELAERFQLRAGADTTPGAGIRYTVRRGWM